MKNLKIRLPAYFIGLFIMTIGISISVKSNLGVAPVSSLPYAVTCTVGIEMGLATMLFHAVLVLLQIALLRKRFKIKNLLQIAVGVVFGWFTTLCNNLVGMLPDTDNMVLRVAMVLVSCMLIAFGLFLYVPSDIMPLAGEGITTALADITHIAFSKMKIIFDVTLVIISLIICLSVLHGLGSVGIGTVVSSLSVGFFLGILTKLLGEKRDRILKTKE